MTRQDEIRQAAFAKEIGALARETFQMGAEWADEHPSEKAINKRLYELGYGMSLNGDIVTRQQVSESMERYVKYKKKQLIDKACEWLKNYRQDTPDGTGYISGIVNDRTIEDFRKAMEE